MSVLPVILFFTACGGALGQGGGGGSRSDPGSFSISGTISGNGGAGATVTLSGGGTATVTADPSGNYSFNNLGAGTYTVTPTKTGFTFTPATQNVTISNANATANFASAVAPALGPGSFSISGTINGPGGAAATVAVTGSANASTTADASGNYSVTNLGSGSYAVTPSRTGFNFTPATQNVTITTANVTANFNSSAASPPPGGGAGMQAVNHIIFLAEENRGFDHYFGKLNEYRATQGLGPDVNGLPDDCSSSNSDWTVPCSAMNKSPDASGNPTTPIYAFHLKTQCIEGLSPDWIVAHWDFNAEDPASDIPKMDGFVISAASAAIANSEKDTAGIRAMGFYTATDLTYHYWLATQFATSDAWFSPVPSRTPANRYYMIAATSGGYAYPVGSGEPPVKAKTIFDLLSAAGVSWKIYTESGFTYGSFFSGFSSRYANTGNIVTDPGFVHFISDAQSGNLPQVVYIEKPDADEKPNTMASIQPGVAETRQLINAVMNGPSWKDSVMIFTFDENGGLYDHVPPPTNVPNPDGIQPLDVCTGPTDSRCTLAALSHPSPPYDPPNQDFTRYGFRVPLVVISPFTKRGYVSHVATDTTAWLKFVEARFNLPPLNARDGWANTSDMLDLFDFQNPPWLTPPQNPPSDGPGQCYDSLP